MKLKPLLLSLLTGTLLILSFPPFGWGVLAFCAFVPLGLAVRDISARGAFGYAYLSGIAFFIGLLYWIVLNPAVEGWVRPLLYIGLALIAEYLALFIAAYAGLFRFIASRSRIPAWLAGPILFTALEYLRSLGWTGFPWGSLGYTQTKALPFVQFAEWTGIWGVTFWVIGANHLFLEVVASRKPRRRIAFAVTLLALIFLPLFHGVGVMSRYRPPRETLRIALIQGNIFQDEKWQDPAFSLGPYSKLTREAVKEKPDLILWPETAMPCFLTLEWGCRKEVEDIARSSKTYLLTGAVDGEALAGKSTAYYNAGFLFAPDGAIAGRYHKRHLVPFGESIPFKESLPFLRNIQFGEAEWAVGRIASPLLLPRASLALFICFESIFPDEVRRVVRAGPRLLVNITNDSWFGRSGAAEQHAQMVVFRAIENRTAIARCANSGISMFVDPLGRTRQATRLFERAVAIGDVPLRQTTTFYTLHGDLFAKGTMLLSLLGALLSLLSKEKLKTRGQKP